MMRYLLDTGVAQEFIVGSAKVVQRVDVARRAGNRIGICTPVLGECNRSQSGIVVCE